MKKAITTIFIVLLSMSFGAGLMYYGLDIFAKRDVEVKEVIIEEKDISEGIEKVFDAVVVVENFQNNRLYVTGSGFIYDRFGFIMTNHHVIDKADEIKVILTSGEVLPAKLIGSDEFADIAVIQIDRSYIKQIASIGNNENTKLGDTVFTIGSPMNASYAGTVTRGILSGKNRLVEVSIKSKYANDWAMNVMQTDAAINPGNSGGPLCDASGNVIGVNSMKIVQDEIEGIGFAIPIEEAMEFANIFTSGQTIKRPVLGIKMIDVSVSSASLVSRNIKIDSSITSGVLVLEVIDGGPSSITGLAVGDVIVKMDSYDIDNSAKLKYYLSKYKPGDTVELKIKRGKEDFSYKVTLKEN